MHCVACDKVLSDFEATRKIVREDGSISYPDLCNTCFRESGLGEITTIVERSDLNKVESLEDLFEDSERYTED